jgi:hypothetical protein
MKLRNAEAAFLLSTGPPPLSPIEQLLVDSGVSLAQYAAVRE